MNHIVGKQHCTATKRDGKRIEQFGKRHIRHSNKYSNSFISCRISSKILQKKKKTTTTTTQSKNKTDERLSTIFDTTIREEKNENKTNTSEINTNDIKNSGFGNDDG